MRKILTALAIMASAIACGAQNIQLHYDFGRTIYTDQQPDRQHVTATFELFHADRLGNWFYFIDMDLGSKGVIGSYMELSREFNLGKHSPFAAHIEFNGGLNAVGGSFQPAGLVGAAWNGHSADFSKTYSVQLLYKQYFKGNNTSPYASVQLTGVWSLAFAGERMTFSGYIDLWRGEKRNGHGQLVILSEPQLWYNITRNLSVGTEVEMSNNFVFNASPESSRTFFVNPTLAVKWRF